MGVSLADVQIKAYDRLINDAPLIALVPVGSIKNHIPQDAGLPYIRFRLSNAGEWDTKSSDGYDISLIIDSWVEEHSDLPIMKIHDAVYNALQRKPLTLAADQNLLVKFISFNTFIESDGHSHHGISTFGLILTT